MDIAFFGHHKCASTSTEAMCFELCNKLGYFPIYKKTAFTKDISTYLKSGGNNFIISTNSKYENIEKEYDFRGFHLIRDPRDICVSGYFSHLHSHNLEGFDRLIEHRKQLKQLDFNKGLFLEIDFTSFWLEHLESWNYNDPRIIEVKLEDIIASPDETWMKIYSWLNVYNQKATDSSWVVNIEQVFSKLNHSFRHLGKGNVFFQNGLSKRTLQNLTTKYTFSKLSKGRKAGNEDVKSHYRKGKGGDWKNHFTDQHKVYFKEKYGPLLIKLGYENNLDW